MEREGPRGKHQLAQAEHTLNLTQDELGHTRKMAQKAAEELTSASRRHADDMDMAMKELAASRTKQTELVQQLREAERDILDLREQLHRAELGAHQRENKARRGSADLYTAPATSHYTPGSHAGIDEFRSRADEMIKPEASVGVAANSPVDDFRKRVQDISANVQSSLDLSDHDKLLKEAGSFHTDMIGL